MYRKNLRNLRVINGSEIYQNNNQVFSKTNYPLSNVNETISLNFNASDFSLNGSNELILSNYINNQLLENVNSPLVFNDNNLSIDLTNINITNLTATNSTINNINITNLTATNSTINNLRINNIANPIIYNTSGNLTVKIDNRTIKLNSSNELSTKASDQMIGDDPLNVFSLASYADFLGLSVEDVATFFGIDIDFISDYTVVSLSYDTNHFTETGLVNKKLALQLPSDNEVLFVDTDLSGKYIAGMSGFRANFGSNSVTIQNLHTDEVIIENADIINLTCANIQVTNDDNVINYLEGENLYYTNATMDNLVLDSLTLANLRITNDDVEIPYIEGENLYYTNATMDNLVLDSLTLANLRITNDDVEIPYIEGENLYYTNATMDNLVLDSLTLANLRITNDDVEIPYIEGNDLYYSNGTIENLKINNATIDNLELFNGYVGNLSISNILRVNDIADVEKLNVLSDTTLNNVKQIGQATLGNLNILSIDEISNFNLQGNGTASNLYINNCITDFTSITNLNVTSIVNSNSSITNLVISNDLKIANNVSIENILVSNFGKITEITSGAIKNSGNIESNKFLVQETSPTTNTELTSKGYVDNITYITAGAGLTKTGQTLAVNANPLGNLVSNETGIDFNETTKTSFSGYATRLGALEGINVARNLVPVPNFTGIGLGIFDFYLYVGVSATLAGLVSSVGGISTAVDGLSGLVDNTEADIYAQGSLGSRQLNINPLKTINITSTNITTATIGNLITSNLQATNIVNTNLTTSNIVNSFSSTSNIINTNLTSTNIINTDLTSTNIVNSFSSTSNIINTNLTASNIVNTNLTSTNIINTNLTSTDIVNSFSSTSNIINTNLTSTNIRNTNSTLTNLFNTNTVSTNIRNSTMTSFNIKNTNITSTNIRNSNLIGFNSTITNILTTDLTASNLVSTNSTLSNINLSNLTASNLVSTNSTLSNLVSTNSTLSNINITNLTTSNLLTTNITASNILFSNLTTDNINVKSVSISPDYPVLPYSRSFLGENGLYIENNISTNGIEINATSSLGAYLLSSYPTRPLTFLTNNGSGNMTFTSAGNLGINTTNPQRRLEVQNNLRVGGSNPVIDFGDNTTTQIYRSGTTSNLRLTTNSIDRLTIQTSGNIGIGNTNPGVLLQVGNGIGLPSKSQISIFNNGEARYHLYNSGAVSEWIFGQKTVSNHDFILSRLISGTETDFFIVNTNGNVGIGTTNPGVKLAINGNLDTVNLQGVHLLGSSSNQHYAVGQSSTRNVFLGWNYNATAGNAFAFLGCFGGSNNLILQKDGGNVGIGTSTPSFSLDVNGKSRIRNSQSVRYSSSTITSATGVTWTVAQVESGYIVRTGLSGTTVDTMPSRASFISAGYDTGDALRFIVHNLASPPQSYSLTAGATWNPSNLLTNVPREFLLRITASSVEIFGLTPTSF